MSNQDIIIEADNISKLYGNFAAVQDVSFTCRRGEIVGFLGPNGAGKTTTMRMLTGYMPPSAGRAYIAGYDTLRESISARRHLGYLPETVPLYEEMTVEGYLAYVAKLRRLEDVWERVDDALESVDMLDRAESYIGKLSRGMRQRIGLAQAIMHEPDALILDEPTIGLDPRQVVDIRSLIRRLGEKHTILLSTHIMSEVEQICDRVIMIFDGQIGADMKMADITGRSNNPTLNLSLATSDESTTDAFSQLIGVSDVQDMGEHRYALTIDGTNETKLRVSNKAQENGWGVLEMTTEKASLEATFLRNMKAAEAANVALEPLEEEE